MININENDLKKLNEYYYKKESSIHYLYGSINSGKTTFLRDFIIKKRNIYINCYPTTINNIYQYIVKIINKKLFLKNSIKLYSSFNHIFDLLLEQEYKEKIIIIFDNFQELEKIDKDAMNIFIKYQKIIKNKLNIQLIISSNKVVLKSDFYKYIDTKIKMEKFNIKNVEKEKGLTNIDKFYIDSFFGSSDNILKLYNKKDNFLKNLYNISLNSYSEYNNYGFNYLKNYFNDIGIYSMILNAISNGYDNINTISIKTNIKQTSLTSYLKKLETNLIISKIVFNNFEFKKSKYSKYRIINNFLNYWFIYIYENQHLIELRKIQSILNEINNDFKNKILNRNYKEYIKEKIKNNEMEILNYIPLSMEEFDYKGIDIDLITYNKKEITFIKISWEDIDVKKEIDILKRKSNKFYTNKIKNYIIFTKSTYLNINT